MSGRESQRMDIPELSLLGTPERPVTFVTKGQLLGAGAIVGVVLAILIGVVVYLGISLHDGQQRQIDDNKDRARDNKDRIKDNEVVTERLNEAVHRLNVITHPTPAQYRRQLREGIRRCLAEPTCRDLFPRLKSHSARSLGTSSTSAAPRRPSDVSRTRPPTHRTPTSEPTPTPEKNPRRRRNPPPSSSPRSHTPPPSPSPPPPDDRPLVSVTTPLVPASVCARVVTVNDCG